MVFGSSVLKTKFTNHKHLTSLAVQGRSRCSGPDSSSRFSPGRRAPPNPSFSAPRRVPASPGTRQRALSGPEGDLRTATRPAGSPRRARTYRSSVPRVGHGQPIKSHESPVSQRQRCCEEGHRCATGTGGLDAVSRASAPGSRLRLWSPAPELDPAPAGVQPRPPRL